MDKFKINNLPKVVYKYVVARVCDGEWWFWGTWDEQEPAVNAALEVKGYVFKREDIE